MLDTPNSPETQAQTKNRPQKARRSEPKTPFDADGHVKTKATIKGIPAGKRNAVRDEAIRRVLRVADMPASYKVVFVKIALDIWWKDGACLLSNREITVECGGDAETSKWIVRRALTELCQRGWVSRRMRPAKAGNQQTAETTIPLLAQVWAAMQGQQVNGVGALVHPGSVTSAPHSSVLSPCRLEQVDREAESLEGLAQPAEVAEDKALRANLYSGKLADADCMMFLKRLTTADSTGALASRLKRNARGLGRFLAAMAEEHGITAEEVVGILEERLSKHRVAGKPVEGEAELNWFADADELYNAPPGWIKTWNYHAGLVGDQVKIRRWHERAETCS